MLKGKGLLDYTINKINGNDKFSAIYSLADEVLELGSYLARRAISLLSPLVQYELLESALLEQPDIDSKLIEYLKSYNYPLPRRFGWKHIVHREGQEDELIDECEWYEDRHTCYCDMFECAMETIKNAIGCTEQEIKIKNDDDSIIIDCIGVVTEYCIYEM